MRVVGGAAVVGGGLLWWGGVNDGASNGTPLEGADDVVDEATESAAPGDGDLEVHFIDAGQGDATLLVAPDATVLVDAGRHTATDVVDYLESEEVTAIDVVAITHPHADHIGQFPDVLERFAVAEVWWSPTMHTTDTFTRAVEALEGSDAAFEEPAASDTTEVGSLHFTFVNPPAGGTDGDLHDNALAFRVTFGDITLLFTGDAERRTEERMLAAGHDLRASVYQVGHHGSSSSSSQSFLDVVSPQVAVYSAGRDNAFGHPHAEVLDRLEAGGVEVYGTDRHGTVVITTDGTDLHVETSDDRATRAPSDDVCLARGRRGACAG